MKLRITKAPTVVVSGVGCRILLMIEILSDLIYKRLWEVL